jgi:hypothetical protein
LVEDIFHHQILDIWWGRGEGSLSRKWKCTTNNQHTKASPIGRRTSQLHLELMYHMENLACLGIRRWGHGGSHVYEYFTQRWPLLVR